MRTTEEGSYGKDGKEWRSHSLPGFPSSFADGRQGRTAPDGRDLSQTGVPVDMPSRMGDPDADVRVAEGVA